MPKDYDDWLAEVNPQPTDAELDQMAAEYEARTQAREAEKNRLFYNPVGQILSALVGQAHPDFTRRFV